MSDEPEEIIEETTAMQEAPLSDVGHMPLMSEKDKSNFIKRIEQSMWMKQAVLKVTNIRHWVMHGDKPYLTEAGCKSVCAVIGLGVRMVSVDESKERDEGGDYYSFTAICKVTYRGRQHEDIGYADSRDPFLAGDRPQSEIRKGNIKKKAITNAMGRAIKGFLGLDFTRVEVEKVTGPLGAAAGVNYKSKKEKEEFTADDLKLRKDLKSKIWSICDENADMAKEYIKKLTTYKDFKGHENFEKITMKQLGFKKDTINSHYVDWESEQKAGEK